MESRYIGIMIATAGTIGVTPDAALLRLMDTFGGSTAVITVWRFLFVGLFNLLFAIVNQGGVRPLVRGIASAPRALCVAAFFCSFTNVGFVVSLLKADPAKALLLISLNPLWAALMGWVFLGDVLERRTIVAQGLSVLSIILVFVPNVRVILSNPSHPAHQDAESELYDLVPLGTGAAIAAFMVYSRYCSQRGVSDASLEAAPPLSSALTALIAVALAHGEGISSLTAGLSPLFWPTLALDSACIAGYNVALVLAPRYLPSAEVALILLGETLLGPVWVYLFFGVVPSPWTLAGGALLLIALSGHEIVALRQQDRAQIIPGAELHDAEEDASRYHLKAGHAGDA